MADRSRRRTARNTLRWIALPVAVALVWRLAGPGILIVRDDALAPFLVAGDVVLARPSRNVPPRGTIVLVPPVFAPSGTILDHLRLPAEESVEGRQDRLVPRIVAAVPGDDVTWTEGSIVAARPDSGGVVYRIAPASLHRMITQDRRRLSIGEEQLFLTTLEAGRFDSRVLGPRPAQTVRYRVTRILWPADRRRPLPPVSSGYRAAP